jgi:hypothetical protein
MISREQVKRAAAAIKSVVDAEYFFDSLKSPEWIRPLLEEGLFAAPPTPVEENQLIAFPFWPQSRYLKRMASLAPEDVLTTILAIPETKNGRVHEDFVDAATAMPGDVAARLTGPIKEWLALPYQLLLPDKVGALIEHLARHDQGHAALDLARTLLAVRADPRSATAEGQPYSLPLEAQGRFHEWQYGQVLEKRIPALVEATGEEGLALLCDLLNTAVESSRPRGEQGEDYSYLWRTAIEEHPLNRDHHVGVRDHLVSAVRDAAIAIVARDPDALPRAVATLESRRWKIFQRIALCLLRLSVPGGVQLVRERMLNPDLMQDVGLFHEFWLMAGAGLPLLQPVDQRTFFSHLDARLKPDERETEEGASEEEREKAHRDAQHWLYRRLSILVDVLPAERAEQLRQLQEQFGPIEHPDFLAYSTGVVWVGSRSPRSADELSRMSLEELAAFLHSWRPENLRDEPSLEGLSQTLTEVVSREADRFARGAETFEGLGPTYVRAVLSGFQEAVKAKDTFPWEPVLRLCAWAIAQPRNIPGRTEEALDDSDPGWGWSRRTIAGLLSSAFQGGAGELPRDLRGTAWRVLEPLTQDPDPTPDHERQFGGNNMDPTTLSINTVRGEAMHAVVHYALWVRRHFEQDPAMQDRLGRGFEEMPEVRSVLEHHLDPQLDASAAVHSVYGQWFAWLLLLDPTWATAQVESIFPSDPALADRLDAAWDAYVIFGGVYDNALPPLLAQYRRAIDRLGRGARRRVSPDRPDDRLAEHLMVFYWRGKLSLHEPLGLLQHFYQHASTELRGHALGFVGRAVRNEEAPPIPGPVRQRLQELMEWRLSAASGLSPEDRATELSEFGWWFASQKFPQEWALSHLLGILTLTHQVDDAGQVTEVLTTMVESAPEQVMDALTLMAEGSDPLGHGLWLEAAEPPIRTALVSDSAAAREKATDLVHLLGAKGYRTFERLLPGREA